MSLRGRSRPSYNTRLLHWRPGWPAPACHSCRTSVWPCRVDGGGGPWGGSGAWRAGGDGGARWPCCLHLRLSSGVRVESVAELGRHHGADLGVSTSGVETQPPPGAGEPSRDGGCHGLPGPSGTTSCGSRRAAREFSRIRVTGCPGLPGTLLVWARVTHIPATPSFLR